MFPPTNRRRWHLAIPVFRSLGLLATLFMSPPVLLQTKDRLGIVVNVCHEGKILFNEISSDTQDFSGALFSCERVLERAREQGGILRARAEVVLCT